MGLSDAGHHPGKSVQKQSGEERRLGPTITIMLQEEVTSRQTLSNPQGALNGRRTWEVPEGGQMPPVTFQGQGVMADAVSTRRRKGGQIRAPWTPLSSQTIWEFQENDSSNLLLSAVSIPNTDPLIRLVA